MRVRCKKKYEEKIFYSASLKSLKKGIGSGSTSQRSGSAPKYHGSPTLPANLKVAILAKTFQKNDRKKSGEEEGKKPSLVASQSFGSSYSLSREMGDLSLGEDDGTEVGLKRRRDSEAGKSSDTSLVGVGRPRKVLLR
jgi:hypothetical protein